jgi:type I restriction-modification system DNA methylase subunit
MNLEEFEKKQKENESTKKTNLPGISQIKIFDPACGSGNFFDYSL